MWLFKIDNEETEFKILGTSSLPYTKICFSPNFSRTFFFFLLDFLVVGISKSYFLAIDLARRDENEKILKTCVTENQWDPPRRRLSVLELI